MIYDKIFNLGWSNPLTLSQPTALEMLSRYFDATRDSDMAPALSQVGQNF